MFGPFRKIANENELYQITNLVETTVAEADALFPESGVFDYDGIRIDYTSRDSRQKLLGAAIMFCRERWLQSPGGLSLQLIEAYGHSLSSMPPCQETAEKAMVYNLALTAIRLDRCAAVALRFRRDSRVRDLFIYVSSMVVYCIDRSCEVDLIPQSGGGPLSDDQVKKMLSSTAYSSTQVFLQMPNVVRWYDQPRGV